MLRHEGIVRATSSTALPPILPPPQCSHSFQHPFNIPESVFMLMLEPKTPIMIGIAYCTSILALKELNRHRSNEPWEFSKKKLFVVFCTVYNLTLVAYSTWSVWTMLNVMRRVLSDPFGSDGVPGTLDSLCHAHGASGRGNFAFYNETSREWATNSANPANVLQHGLPDRVPMGRLWNEGLGYYGWIFYATKYIELTDTFILIAKGKSPSFLQVYHHTGGIILMWLAVRYMAANLWYGILSNCFVHMIMYTYFAASTLSIRVPKLVKSTVTRLQITHLIVGIAYTLAQLWISIPPPRSSGSLAISSTEESSSRVALNASMSPLSAAEPCITTTSELAVAVISLTYGFVLTYLFGRLFSDLYWKVRGRGNAVKQ